MSCPKKNKHCECQQICKAANNNYLCVGKNKKPKFACDTLKLCGKGMASAFAFEMTPDEALIIINLLSMGVYNIIDGSNNDVK